MIALGTCVFMIALTPSYASLVTDLFILPTLLLVLVFTHLHDESTATHIAGVATVMDLMSQSILTVGIVIIEYLLFLGFCVPF